MRVSRLETILYGLYGLMGGFLVCAALSSLHSVSLTVLRVMVWVLVCKRGFCSSTVQDLMVCTSCKEKKDYGTWSALIENPFPPYLNSAVLAYNPPHSLVPFKYKIPSLKLA